MRPRSEEELKSMTNSKPTRQTLKGAVSLTVMAS